MPTTLPEGIVVPAGSDAYNLVPDLRTMMESATTIVPVPNQAARTALVAGLTAAGRAPSPANPLIIHRQDTGVIETTVDPAGSAWIRRSGPSATVTATVPLWSSSLVIRREVTDKGFKMTLRGRMSRTSGAFTLDNGTFVGIGSFTIPDDMKGNIQPTDAQAIVSAFPNASTPGSPILFLLNTTTGAMTLRSPTASQSWVVGGYFQVEGVTWYRDL